MTSTTRRNTHYIVGEQDVTCEEAVAGTCFYVKRRTTNTFMLVKVYRKNGGERGRESVAVMNADTNEHVGYPRVRTLFRAIETEQTFGEMLVAYLHSLSL